MEFYARKLDNKTFDVFEGKQYSAESWTRLRSGRNGVYVAKGRSLPHAVVRAIAAAIQPDLNGQLVTLQ